MFVDGLYNQHMPDARAARAISKAVEFLLASRNGDGGWGYAHGRLSTAEPTAYSLLGLSEALPKADFQKVLEKGTAWFEAHTGAAGAISSGQRGATDAALVDNWGTMLALYSLRRLSAGAELTARYIKYLQGSSGNRIDRKTSQDLNLNGDLLAWSWARGTASWVEPTAYALLAMKASGLAGSERVKSGEAFLIDRACYEGGWNYGNKEVLKVRLEPMPTNTCFALLALQDLDRKNETINRAVDYLQKELSQHQSALFLSLGTLCFDIYGAPYEKAVAQLIDRQEADGSWRGNVHLTSLALCALNLAGGRRNVFKLS